MSTMQAAVDHKSTRCCGGCTACCTVLAVDDLAKPMRCACSQLVPGGCRIYDARPNGCRQFDCAWLRGEIGDDESWRPDHLGVIFDDFVRATDGVRQFTALEVWSGALENPLVRSQLEGLTETADVVLSYRDGAWSRLELDRSVVE